MLCYLFGVLLYELFSWLHQYQQRLLQRHDMGKVFDKTKNENNKNVDTIEGLMSKKKNIKFFFHPEQWSLFAYGLVRRNKFIFNFFIHLWWRKWQTEEGTPWTKLKLCSINQIQMPFLHLVACSKPLRSCIGYFQPRWLTPIIKSSSWRPMPFIARPRMLSLWALSMHWAIWAITAWGMTTPNMQRENLWLQCWDFSNHWCIL